jgi:hypothetical protein
MALFYVTGLPGTGKPAVLNELQARGYYAHGAGQDGYAGWINRADGTPDEFPSHDPDPGVHPWYRAHEWVLGTGRIAALSRQAARPVSLCGTARGDATAWHLSEKVLALAADVPALKQRIGTRTNEFGTAPEELAAILRWHAGYETAYRSFGAVIIDAARSLGHVVDEILTASIPAPADQDEIGSLGGFPRSRYRIPPRNTFA